MLKLPPRPRFACWKKQLYGLHRLRRRSIFARWNRLRILRYRLLFRNYCAELHGMPPRKLLLEHNKHAMRRWYMVWHFSRNMHELRRGEGFVRGLNEFELMC